MKKKTICYKHIECVFRIKRTQWMEWYHSFTRSFIHSYIHWFSHLFALVYNVSHGDYYFNQSDTNLSKHFLYTRTCHLYTKYYFQYKIQLPNVRGTVINSYKNIHTRIHSECLHSHRFCYILQSKSNYMALVM